MTATGLKWLKGFHIMAVCCWFGGGVALFFLSFLKSDVNDGGVLYGINQSIHFVDIAVVVVPGAMGCLFTGLIYGFFLRFGFFRHGWLIYKWIITITAFLFGALFLGPWETRMVNMSGQMGLAALNDARYLHNQKMLLIFGTVQCLLLMATIFVSIFKPWKNFRKTAKHN